MLFMSRINAENPASFPKLAWFLHPSSAQTTSIYTKMAIKASQMELNHISLNLSAAFSIASFSFFSFENLIVDHEKSF